MKVLTALFAAGAAIMIAGTGSAEAAMKLCNKTESRVGIAMGYKNKDGWASEGWWTAKPNECLTLIKTDLIARFYYIYAVDYDKGGSWGGKSAFCIREKIFTIRGHDNCSDRGYQKAQFFEVDTGEEKDWTISLSGNKTSATN
jgi:uncharacterized membrane protein